MKHCFKIKRPPEPQELSKLLNWLADYAYSTNSDEWEGHAPGELYCKAVDIWFDEVEMTLIPNQTQTTKKRAFNLVPWLNLFGGSID
jgi:hypothetical protein